jgi:hypothetical protein
MCGAVCQSRAAQSVVDIYIAIYRESNRREKLEALSVVCVSDDETTSPQNERMVVAGPDIA